MSEVFWHNNERSRALFYQLVERVKGQRYDEEYLTLLDAYERERPQPDKLAVFAATYMLAHGEAAAAVEYGEEAWLFRPLSYEVLKILAEGYQRLGRATDALIMRGYLHKLYHESVELQGELPDMPIALDRLSIALGEGAYAPLAQRRAFYEKEGLIFRPHIFFAEFLPFDYDAEYRYWVGAYGEERAISMQGLLLKFLRTQPSFVGVAKNYEGTFDIRRSKEVETEYRINVGSENKPLLLPLAGTATGQKLYFMQGDEQKNTVIGVAEYSLFRIEKDTVIKSDKHFVVGKSIPLVHLPKRKKLVLNIMVDALSYPVIKKDLAKYMPRAKEFFDKGVIFNNHFTVAEFTFPALCAIETGRYPHHNQIFSESDSHPLPQNTITLSERMKDLGYYTVNLMGGGEGINTGYTRGYDRLLVTSYYFDTYVAVERIIRQLDALSECDQFIYCHTMDIHPSAVNGYNYPEGLQAKMNLFERMANDEKNVPSVHLRARELYQENFYYQIRKIDRTLGVLFDYLEENFSDDEYIISLYSDHGQSVFDEYKDLLSERMTGAAWMMRGSGVPAVGTVDEMTSSIDLYPTLGHLTGFPIADNIDGKLPKIFGGEGREYVISNSLFPWSSYKLAIRTPQLRFSVVTDNLVDEEGMVDFDNAEVFVVTREDEPREVILDDSLKQYFYPIARDFVKSLANNGEIFPAVLKDKTEKIAELERKHKLGAV